MREIEDMRWLGLELMLHSELFKRKGRRDKEFRGKLVFRATKGPFLRVVFKYGG